MAYGSCRRAAIPRRGRGAKQPRWYPLPQFNYSTPITIRTGMEFNTPDFTSSTASCGECIEPVRISTPAVHSAISRCNSSSAAANAP